MLSRVGDMGFLLFIVSGKNGTGVITHVPAFYPIQRGEKDKKSRAIFAVYVVIDGWVAISGRTVWRKVMSSYTTCFLSFFHT
jgi:hypothetical protein